MNSYGGKWLFVGHLDPSYRLTLFHRSPKGVSDLGRKKANLMGVIKLELTMVTFPLLDREM